MGNMGHFFGRLLFFPPAKQKCVRGRGEYQIANWIAMDTNHKPAKKNWWWGEKRDVSQEIFTARKFVHRINI